MDEEKKQEEDKPETPVENSDEGSKPETTTLIDDANIAAKRMEEANKVKKELLDREEKLQANSVLGGSAGAAVPQKPTRLTDTEYAEALERGEVNPLEADGFI